MTLKVLLDVMSQPSRAVLIFCRAAAIPHEFKPIMVKNLENKTDHFLKINPLGTVPAIDDGGVAIKDSSAILRYLCRTRDLPDHWFPRDPASEAKVDEFLHWQHLNVRAGCALYFIKRWLEPITKQTPPNEADVARQLKIMTKVLNTVESVWLENGKNKYISGSEKISVADIMACCELEQPLMAGYDVREGRPILSEYMNRIKAELNPHYDDAHKIVFQMAKKFGGDIPGIYEPRKEKSNN